jgi:Protein prenyltransferase alpha subunit repeat
MTLFGRASNEKNGKQYNTVPKKYHTVTTHTMNPGSLLVDRLSELLDTNPTDFDITILPPRTTTQAEEGDDPWILQEGHLGINATDLAWLARDFRHAYRMACRRQKNNNKDDKDNDKDDLMLLKVTRCLLLLCPDHATAWADRKRALLKLQENHPQQSSSQQQQQQHQQKWNKELQFLNLLMTRHTKAPTSWFHRKFVFSQLLLLHQQCHGKEEEEEESDRMLMNLAKNEMALCTSVAERYPKNYYAWTHRIHVLQTLYHHLFNNINNNDNNTTIILTRMEPQQQQRERLICFLQEEWEFTTTWLKSHVSDHSAAHFGGRVLNMLGSMYPQQQQQQQLECDHGEEERGLVVLNEAVAAARQFVERSPTHEVLWIFRRICSHELLTFHGKKKRRRKQQQLHTKKLPKDDNNNSYNNTTALLAEFGEQEITGLVQTIMDERRTQLAEECKNTDDMSMEATRILIYQLSYVAWILETMISLARQGDLDYHDLGFSEDEIRTRRVDVLGCLQEIDAIPFHIYRLALCEMADLSNHSNAATTINPL